MLQEKRNTEFNRFIKRLVTGAYDVYFRDVIKASSGQDVLEVKNEHLAAVKNIYQTINGSLQSISNNVQNNYVGRANELSNYLEKVIKDLINKLPGFNATIPTVGTKKQTAGYPDLIVEFNGKYIYIEIKTYQKKTLHSSLRSFYFEPSTKNKISHSCPHILIGFEVESLGQENRSPFMVKAFKIITLYDLKVDLKPEFNTNNPGIYKPELIIFQS